MTAPAKPATLHTPVRLAAAGSFFLFALRHGLALLLLPLAAALLWTAAYFILLFFAAIFGGGLGGPLAWPAGLVFFGGGSFLLIAMALAPGCGLAELLRRIPRWPRLTALPLAMASAALAALLWGMLLSPVGPEGWHFESWLPLMAFAAAVQLPYWLLVEGLGGLAASIARRLRR